MERDGSNIPPAKSREREKKNMILADSAPAMEPLVDLHIAPSDPLFPSSSPVLVLHV
jgi:hypothetical protein